MEKPLVSAILTAYNGEAFLSEAIASVVAQGYRPIEILVVDDGSTDGTAEIAQSFEGVRYIYQMNQGVAAAMNRGVKAAAGGLLAFLDMDDLWEPHKLELQVGYLMEHPEVDYVIAKTRNFLEPGVQLPARVTKDLSLTDSVILNPGTLVARKAVFKVVGIFDASYTRAADFDWFIRAKEAGLCMAILPEVLLHRRIHGSNLSLHMPAKTSEFMRAVRSSIERRRGEGRPQEKAVYSESQAIAEDCSPPSRATGTKSAKGL
ncbi:MAG: glycosyltransferase [Anaerolineae bacterium]|nr:glycosyltransferase [Anaerolineae bacterium]